MGEDKFLHEFGSRWQELGPLERSLVRGHAIVQQLEELNVNNFQALPDGLTTETLYPLVWPEVQSKISELFEKAREENAVDATSQGEIKKLIERQKIVEGIAQDSLRKKIALELAKKAWHEFEAGPGVEITRADTAQTDHDKQERRARIAGPSFDAKAAPLENIRNLLVVITRTRQPGRQIDSYQVTFPHYQEFLQPLQDRIIAIEKKIRELRLPLQQPWWSQVLETTRTWTDKKYWARKKERRMEATTIEDSELGDAERELVKIKTACEQLPRMLSEDFLSDDRERTEQLFGSEQTITMSLSEILDRLRALAVQPPQPYEEPIGLAKIRAKKEELTSEISRLEFNFKDSIVELRLADNFLRGTAEDVSRFQNPQYMSLDSL